MNSRRLHLILLATIVLLCAGLLFGALGINKLLAAESKKLVDLKAKSQALAQEELSLKAAKKDIKKYAELEKITRAVVPEDKSQAEAVRELVKIAQENNIKLGSITFPASTLGSNVKPGASAAPSASTTPGAAAGKAADLSQLEPVKGIPGVYLLVINVSSDANQPVLYSRFVNFLSDLERNRRTAQVSAITLQPDSDNPNLLSFSLTLNGYIKP